MKRCEVTAQVDYEYLSNGNVKIRFTDYKTAEVIEKEYTTRRAAYCQATKLLNKARQS